MTDATKTIPTHESKPTSRGLAATLVLLMLLAFLWRLFNIRFTNTYYDGIAYIMTAKSILRGHLATPYICDGILYHYRPLYPAVMALVSLISGDIFRAARLVNVLAGTLLIWPVYGFARDLFGKRAGLFAAALVVFHPTLVALSSNAYSETLFILFSAFALWWCWKAFSDGSLVWAASAGIMFGLAYLTRSQGVAVLAGAVGGACLAWLLFRRSNLKKTIAVLFVIGVAYVASTVPYNLYMLKTTGSISVGGKVKQEFFKKNSTFGEKDWFIWERSLDRDGTRFIWQDIADNETVAHFISENTEVYARRVVRDFGVALKYLSEQDNLPALLILGLIVQLGADLYRRRNLDLLFYLFCYVFAIVASLALAAAIMNRYVSVAIPVLLVLGGGGWGKIGQYIHSIRSTPEIPAWVQRKLPYLLVLFCLFIYPFQSFDCYAQWKDNKPDEEYKTVAEWLNTYLDPNKPEIVMSTHPYVQGYSGDIFYMMPIGGAELVGEYARRQKADYILVERNSLAWYGVEPVVQDMWIKGNILAEGLTFVGSVSYGAGARYYALYRVDKNVQTAEPDDNALQKAVAEIVSSPPEIKRGPRGERYPNVILISLDTLRSDHLHCYGYNRDTSPTMDLLAGAGVRFENVVSHCPKTGPSHMSMLTSLYPSEHQVHWDYDKNKGIVLSPKWETLAEILQERGYATGAFVGGGQVTRECGFDRGFDHYEESLGDINEGKVARIVNWLERQTKKSVPAFIFVHTYQIHDPYTPPQPYEKMYDPDYKGWIVGNRDELRALAGEQGFDAVHKIFWGQAPTSIHGDNVTVNKFTPRDVEHMIALYDGGIRYTDSVLQMMFEHMNKEGLLGNTFIIITSDHGEEFMEHGQFLHRFLYRETLDVPLIMFYPAGLPAGKVITQPVQLIDLMPTIVNMLGIPIPSQARGESLLPLVEGKEIPRQDIYSEEPYYLNGLHQGLRSDPYFLYEQDGVSKLFDISKDPNEQVDLSAELPEVTKRLHDEMYALRADIIASGKGQKTKTVEMSEKRKHELRALGYIE